MHYSFKNDYSEGAHPRILELLVSFNNSQQEGYGEDYYSEKARLFIKEKIQNQEAEIHFISGGTQANLTVIAAALKPYESVIAAHSGHIHTHEAGSIEATGHKINAVYSKDGKLTVNDIKSVLDEHIIIPHMVVPKMVYISNATEMGTIYSKEELKVLYEFCQKNNMLLFMDGARLGSALSAKVNDLTLKDMAQYTDVFYIGGTKNGALLGEAIVITNENLKKILGYHLKQRGALLAKGRVLGIQFYGLFEDDLFFKLAEHANEMSKILANAFIEKGFDFLLPPTTNQIFPILPYSMIDDLSNTYGFYIWEKVDKDHAAIRLVTSWMTPKTIVNQMVQTILNYNL